MAELKFETGVQEYTVHGVNGDVIIRFNPMIAISCSLVWTE